MSKFVKLDSVGADLLNRAKVAYAAEYPEEKPFDYRVVTRALYLYIKGGSDE